MRHFPRVEVARITFLDRLLNLVRDEFGGGCAGDSIEIKIKIIVGTSGAVLVSRSTPPLLIEIFTVSGVHLVLSG